MNLGGALTGLVGSGGPGGAFSPQAQAQALQRQQQQQVAAALQQMYGAQQGTPEGKVVQQYAGQQQSQGQQGQQQPPDMNQILQKIYSMPGIDPLTKQQMVDKVMPYYVEQRKEYHENELDKYNQARAKYYDTRADADFTRADKARDWRDPAQRPQVKPVTEKDSGEDKDALKALDDDVAIWKQEVMNAPQGRKHDEAMAEYKKAVKARSVYHKNKKTALPDTSKDSGPASGVPVPDEMKDQPDGTTVPDETGKLWKKQGNQLVPQG